MCPDPPDESFAALFERGGTRARGRTPRVGEIVDALVVQVGKDAVYVDLGDHVQAFVDSADLRDAAGTLKATTGDRLRARVRQVDPVLGIRLVPTVEAAAAAGAAIAVGGGDVANAVRIAVGQIVSGAVERVEKYGLFVQIEGTHGRSGRGLLPTAELAVARGTDLRKAFPLGTKMRAKVIEIVEGKIRLSVRALKEDEERAEYDGFRKSARPSEPAGLGTLGDMLSARATKIRR